MRPNQNWLSEGGSMTLTGPLSIGSERHMHWTQIVETTKKENMVKKRKHCANVKPILYVAIDIRSFLNQLAASTQELLMKHLSEWKHLTTTYADDAFILDSTFNLSTGRRSIRRLGSVICCQTACNKRSTKKIENQPQKSNLDRWMFGFPALFLFTKPLQN